MGNVVQLGIKVTSDVAGGVAGLSKAEGMLGKFKIAAAAGAAALGAAAVGVGAFAVDAVKSAGDLEQSMGAIDTVFKGSAGQMHQWSKDAAQSVGLARNEYNELGTLIGTQLKNGGTAMDELAPKTQNLIQTGADLSSMFGGTTKEAVEALSSALKGERDPIEKYGVSLNQARIDAKAAELGFSKVGGTLSAEANQAATLALIMEQTADAHGNFAKEADTLQGKQQRFAAELENTKTIIGTALLPIASQLFGFFNDKLAPILGTLAEQFAAWMGNLDVAGWWTQLTSGVTGAGDALGGFMPMIQQLVSWFNDSVRPALEGFATAAQERFTAVSEIVGEFITGFLEKVSPLAPQIQEIIGTVGEIFTEGINLVTALWDAGTQALLAAWEVVGPPIIDTVSTIFTAVTGIVGPALDTVKGLIKTALAILKGDWSGAWNAIKETVSSVWNLIKGIVSGAISIVKNNIDQYLGLISSAWSGIWDNIKVIASNAWDAIKDAVSNGIEAVYGFFRDLPGKITGALSGLSSSLYDVGTNMIKGLINGVKAMAGRVADAARSVVTDAIASARAALGIRSPSRVFAQMGVYIGKGLVGGIDSQAGAVARAGDRLANAAVADVPGPVDIPVRATFVRPTTARTISGDARQFAGGSGAAVNITVNGALDPLAVSRQIRDLLNEEARFSGRVAVNAKVVA